MQGTHDTDQTNSRDDDGLDPRPRTPAPRRDTGALSDGDTLAVTRLHDMLELTLGNLITHARKLEDAGYLTRRRRATEQRPAQERPEEREAEGCPVASQKR